jgi:hypothetical protein
MTGAVVDVAGQQNFGCRETSRLCIAYSKLIMFIETKKGAVHNNFACDRFDHKLEGHTFMIAEVNVVQSPNS